MPIIAKSKKSCCRNDNFEVVDIKIGQIDRIISLYLNVQGTAIKFVNDSECKRAFN